MDQQKISDFGVPAVPQMRQALRLLHPKSCDHESKRILVYSPELTDEGEHRILMTICPICDGLLDGQDL